MAKDPAFLFYSSDFLTGTIILNFEERGKYITILALMHQQGRMNEETICFIVGSVSVNLKSKFGIDKNGFWFNKRLEEETEKRNNFTKSRRDNGLKGGRKAKDKPTNNHMLNHMDNHMEDENENRNESIIITNGKKYLNTDFEILPEQYIISSIQQIKLQKQQTITADVINQMWDVFKLQNLTGDKFYNNENEVYKHFGNWIKNQKFEKNGTKPTNEARWDARVEWANQFNSKGTPVNKD